MSAPVAEKRKKYVSRLHSLEHIEGEMRARVAAGRWVAGAMLPGRRALADEFGVDVHTVQRAISPLINDGTLRVDSRRGTLVNDGGTAIRPPRTGSSASFSFASKPEPLAQKTLAIISTITPYLSQNQAYWPVIVLHTFERYLAEHGGIDVRYMNTIGQNGSRRTTQELLEGIASEKIDAIALICPDPDLEEVRSLMEALGEETRLLLNVTSVEPYPKSIPYLTYDNHVAGFHAARHMIGNGYRDLLFFSPVTTTWSEARLAGIREAIHAPGNPPISLRVDSGDGDAKSFREHPMELATEMAKPLLDEGIGGTGVIATNDMTALGLLKRAEAMNLEAGLDYGLIGFDDAPEAREHGLSSLHPPLEDMGKEAAGIIGRALRGQRIPSQVQLHSHLIPRRSSQRLTVR